MSQSGTNGQLARNPCLLFAGNLDSCEELGIVASTPRPSKVARLTRCIYCKKQHLGNAETIGPRHRLILFLSAVLLLSDLGHRNQSSAASGSATAQKRKVVIVYLARSGAADMCMQGLREGLQSTGFEEGRNLEIRRVDAQGEMINVPAILQNYDNSDVDAILRWGRDTETRKRRHRPMQRPESLFPPSQICADPFLGVR